MSLFKLTLKSILSRKLISILLILSIGLSTMLLIGVQKIKTGAKDSFSNSISGTDLIVGARTGDIQLLLYTVFRQGQAVANMSWESVEAIKSFSQVDWLVPISLGDSHRGYPVLATTADYFKHYRYGKKQPIQFSHGRAFEKGRDVVLGAEVAKRYKYHLGDTLYLSHGAGGHVHEEAPFKVVGILKPTSTPIDKTVHITLAAKTALHSEDPKQKIQPQDDHANHAEPDHHGHHDHHDHHDHSAHNHSGHDCADSHSIEIDINLTPEAVTGCLLGLKSKFAIFSVQRRINNWPDEAIMAIIPGLSLSKLWSSISTIDAAFFMITILVTLIAFIGLLLALFMSLNQRRRELAILRSMGAHPIQLFYLLLLESLLITVNGVVVGLGLMVGLGSVISPILEAKLGVILSLTTLSPLELGWALAIIIFGGISSIIPGILAYKRGRSEGIVSI